MPLPSSIVPDNQIAGAALKAGFPENEIVTAVAVALGESGGNRNAEHKNGNGSIDRGLWQINSIHKFNGDWGNQDVNAQMAFKVWQGAGGKWTPWSVYNNGRYRIFLERAKVAAGNPDRTGVTTEGDTPGLVGEVGETLTAPMQALQQFGAFLGKASNPKTWASVGIILLGTLIIIIVAIRMVTKSTVVKKAASAAADFVPGGSIAKTVAKKGIVKTATQATTKAVKADLKPPKVGS